MTQNFSFQTSDALTENGLVTASNNELLDLIQQAIQQIYSPTGEPIDFTSSSPDGQFTNLLATMGTINRELITQVYNATDPSKCEGTQQDSKYQLNYCYRNGGTYTIQNIDVTANKTVTLQGLDGSYNDNTSSAFTVSDENGNLWYLIDSTTVQRGTTSLPFRAQNTGAIVPTVGTITNIVTVIDGITNVINDVGYTSLGQETESNTAYRLRRERSVYIPSGNAYDSIISQILSLEGVIDANGENNNTNETSAQGTEPHTIWVIVNGGSNEDIANIIYSNMAGSGTRGNVVIDTATISAQVIPIRFDRPNPISFFIRFDLQPAYTELTVNKQLITDFIGTNLTFLLGENLSTAKVTTVIVEALDSLGSIGYPINVQVSLGGSSSFNYTPSSTATAGYTTTPDIIANVTEFQKVTDGTLTIQVDGVEKTIVELNFQGDESLQQIATKINAQLTNVTISVDGGNKLRFTSDSYGDTSTVKLLPSTSPSGTDLYGTSYLNGAEQAEVQGLPGNSLSNIQVNNTVLQQYIGNVESQNYNFVYNLDGWAIGDQTVDIANYGVTYTGTPNVNDKLTLNYTEGEWSNFIECKSLQNFFVTNSANIFINVLQSE